MVTAAIIFTIVIHTLGVPVMIWAVRGDQGFKGFWNWLPSDDEDGGGGSKLPDDPTPAEPSGDGAPCRRPSRPASACVPTATASPTRPVPRAAACDRRRRSPRASRRGRAAEGAPLRRCPVLASRAAEIAPARPRPLRQPKPPAP